MPPIPIRIYGQTIYVFDTKSSPLPFVINTARRSGDGCIHVDAVLATTFKLLGEVIAAFHFYVAVVAS